MKKHLGFITACAASAFVLFSCSQQEEGNGYITNGADQEFALSAALSNSAAIDAALMTEEKSDSADIEAYGEMVANNHAFGQARLKAIAESAGLYAPDSLDAAHVGLHMALMDTTGRGFDSLYIHNQVADHQAAIAVFENEVRHGRYQRLRDYAREALPVLREHLAQATTLAEDY
jgi:putative membrane protein